MSENKMVSRGKGVAAAFLGAIAAASFALAAGHPVAASPAERSVSRWVPPGMHEADASADIGPGSDEAQAAGSPSAE